MRGATWVRRRVDRLHSDLLERPRSRCARAAARRSRSPSSTLEPQGAHSPLAERCSGDAVGAVHGQRLQQPEHLRRRTDRGGETGHSASGRWSTKGRGWRASRRRRRSSCSDAALFWRSPFDPEKAEVTGSEQTVVEGVGGEPSSAAGYFAAGAGGTLAYVPSEAISTEKTVARVEADGSETVLPMPPRNYWYPRLSPDARTLALDIGSGQGTDDDIWLYEIATNHLSRLTLQPASLVPVWSPDGRWIAFGGATSGRDAIIFRKRADGSGGEERIWKGHDFTIPMAWSPDGRSIVASDNTPETHANLISVAGGEARPLVPAAGSQWGVDFSPDGRFVAYTTSESGIDEVLVSTFPEGGEQVADPRWTEGGQPAWSRDGKRILFILRRGGVRRRSYETAGVIPRQHPARALPRSLRPAHGAVPELRRWSRRDFLLRPSPHRRRPRALARGGARLAREGGIGRRQVGSDLR